MQIDDEIPLLLMLIYLFRCVAPSTWLYRLVDLFLDLRASVLRHVLELRERQSQVGSLAGAAHLLNDNAGVLR